LRLKTIFFNEMSQLKLSSNKVIAGVCGGYAEFFGLDATLVRIIFVVLAVLGSAGLWIYLISWLVMALSNK
jgi:phage shock protein C